MRRLLMTLGLVAGTGFGAVVAVAADKADDSVAIRWVNLPSPSAKLVTEPQAKIEESNFASKLDAVASTLPAPTAKVALVTPAAPAIAKQPETKQQTQVQQTSAVQAIAATPVAKPARKRLFTHRAPATKQTTTGRWTIKESTGREPSLISMIASDPMKQRMPRGSHHHFQVATVPTSQIAQVSTGTVQMDVVENNFATQMSCNSGCCGNSCCDPSCGCGPSCGCDSGCGGGCCDSGCGGGCSLGGRCCGPIWSFGIDAIFLDRERNNATGELVSCNCDENLFFAPNGFDPGITAAPRFRFYRSSPDGADFEVTYFNLDSWHNQRYFTGDLNVLGTDLGPNSAATACFESQLQSLEINMVRCHGCWTKLITGFRWLQLDEYACVLGTNGTVAVGQEVNVTNDLYGGHFGFRRLLYDYGGCLTFDSTVKAGVFGNDIDRCNCTPTSVVNNSSNGVSFVGDVEFQANFMITCNCTFTAGYQLLWLTGLASAPEQFDYPTVINKGETLFYHGATVGMVYTF